MIEHLHSRLADYWDSKRRTRFGQFVGLMALGVLLVCAGALKAEGLTAKARLLYGLIGGVGLGAILNLVLLVPAMWLARIRRLESAGEPVGYLRVLLVIYFVPGMPLLLGLAILVLNVSGVLD